MEGLEETPSLLDTVLKYGLFLGAVFQLICIFAVIFIPSNIEEVCIVYILMVLVLSPRDLLLKLESYILLDFIQYD